jgi:Zn-dependent metalloprotease
VPITGCPICCIAPPDLLAAVAERGDAEDRRAALRTLEATATLRAQRVAATRRLRQPGADGEALGVASRAGGRRTVYDVAHGGEKDLPGRKVRGEGDRAVPDTAVNEAYDGAGLTYRFYKDVYDRDSIDGRGMELVSSVHYGTDFDNAFWNGSQMVYGDGSGRIFARGGLTKDVDVIAHELTHGVTQMSAGLDYSKQPGALNESFSDVFGSLVKQHHLGQTAGEADWLIGAGVLGSALHGQALRSMKAPGTANDLDRQAGAMSGYADLPDDNDPAHDNGGVHINSGIPNRVFYLAAIAIGGPAWEAAGRIWYVTLTQHLEPASDFRAAADATVTVAGELFGAAGHEHQAVSAAWKEVGVL